MNLQVDFFQLLAVAFLLIIGILYIALVLFEKIKLFWKHKVLGLKKYKVVCSEKTNCVWKRSREEATSYCEKYGVVIGVYQEYPEEMKK